MGDPVTLGAPTHTGDQLNEPMVTLRTPAELADALPYLLGFKPEDSIVLIALHGERGRFGGRVRLGIPERAEDWTCVAEQLAQVLVGGCERRGDRPDGIVAFLCREPGPGGSGQRVMERLRPLAQVLRTACGALDVPVFEVVCISDHRFWTYCCPDTRCCPPEGIPLLRPGTSVLAAASTYMGVRVDATQSDIRSRLTPWAADGVAEQERALDAASLSLIPRMMIEEDEGTAWETLDLARRIMARLADAPGASGTLAADSRDDMLIAHDEAAALIIGLQVRTTRDRAAAWMEGDVAPAALRLWRALSRRCVGAYAEHAAAPLSLAGWVAWSLGDLVEGQEGLDMALRADPEYMFALLLHRACNDGMDPESIRRCLRAKSDGGDAREAAASRGPSKQGISAEDKAPHGASAQDAPPSASAEDAPPSASTGDEAAQDRSTHNEPPQGTSPENQAPQSRSADDGPT
ncbi:DUF4192 domain-containing protein, partial [Streptomyces flavofungini]|uniref:DUF4192 domain-containing protein n=1 Tax=Streptomyces flavofungini TaxID=68200 RepID=UPI003F7F01A5